MADPAQAPRQAAVGAALDAERYNDLAMALDVRVIHVAERDTQVTDVPKLPGEFVNTWSVDGFYEEGVAPAEMGWGTHERTLPPLAMLHAGEGPLNQICLARMAHKTLVRSTVPSGPIVGMVIRHGEAFTICDHLTVWDGARAAYRPTVHYAYCPADVAWASFVELEGNQYEYPQRQRILNDEITAGRDELGVLVMGHPYRSWWTGMLTSIDEARAVAPHQNATTVQVAASILGALDWMLRRPSEGVRVPDELPWREVLDVAVPYVGTTWSGPIDWDPVSTHADWFDAYSGRDPRRRRPLAVLELPRALGAPYELAPDKEGSHRGDVCARHHPGRDRRDAADRRRGRVAQARVPQPVGLDQGPDGPLHHRARRARGPAAPGDTIVEASSGNTGNAMSMVAAVKGYKMIVVMPEGLSAERTAISVAFGAQVHTVGTFHVNQALEEADRLGQLPGYFAPHQFSSEWNVEENRTWLGPEILSQLPPGSEPAAFVMGVGTGGTLIGVGQAFRAANPDVLLVALEPSESCTILCGDTGLHRIEGISDGFVPEIYARHSAIVDRVVSVTSDDAVSEMRRLGRVHGLLVGPSTGAHMIAARGLQRELGDDAVVVTVACDEGEKYLSEYFVGPQPTG